VAQVGEDDGVGERGVEKGRGIFDGINGMDGMEELMKKGSQCRFDVVADDWFRGGDFFFNLEPYV